MIRENDLHDGGGVAKSGSLSRGGARMKAWIVDRPGPISGGPLREVQLPDPHPGAGPVRVRVLACGVCRTDLHLAEGDLPPRRPGVVPGH